MMGKTAYLVTRRVCHSSENWNTEYLHNNIEGALTGFRVRYGMVKRNR
jgi:hypothetical protein